VPSAGNTLIEDGSSEMSYLNGLIYHYASADEALADLYQVLG